MTDVVLSNTELIARVDLTTDDNKYFLQGVVVYDEVMEHMCCGFVLYEYYEGHYSKCHEEMPLGYSFRDNKGDCLHECIKFLEHWFETNLERTDYTTTVHDRFIK